MRSLLYPWYLQRPVSVGELNKPSSEQKTTLPRLVDLLGCSRSSSPGGHARIPVVSGRPRVLDGPLVSLLVEGVGVVHHHLCYLSILRVLWLGALEQRLQRKKCRLDGQNGRPRRTKRVKTYGSLLYQTSAHRRREACGRQVVGWIHTVWLLMLGCQTLVSKRIRGGRNGYSVGILTSTMKLPPSYGVPGGPVIQALRWVKSPVWSAGWAVMLLVESASMSASSLAILLVRLDMLTAASCRYTRGRCPSLAASVAVATLAEATSAGAVQWDGVEGGPVCGRRRLCQGPSSSAGQMEGLRT